MKVIDLLNKIANDDIPKKIIYDGTIYKYDNYCGDSGYVDKTQLPCKWFVNEINCDIKDCLNDEVEIIEDKKIEKIKILNCDNYVKKGNYETILTMQEIALDIQTLRHKLDEIIDRIKEEDK